MLEERASDVNLRGRAEKLENAETDGRPRGAEPSDRGANGHERVAYPTLGTAPHILLILSILPEYLPFRK